MNILQICSKVPFPPKDGGSVAMDILTHGLIAAGNKVDVLAINTPKHFVKLEDVDSEYKFKTNYKLIFVDTDIKPFEAFCNLFTSESYNIIRFFSKDFENQLKNQLIENQYDLIQLETLWVTPYIDIIRQNSKAKVVLRSQNIEYKIWEKLAEDTSNPLKKWYLKILSNRLKNYEYKVLNSFDAILPITEIDAADYKQMGCKVPIYFVPFGIDLSKYKVDHSNLEKPSVFHIGAMDWLPNINAIQWFIHQVWSKVTQKHPNLMLYLAGRNMPVEMLNLKVKNVVVVGEVADSHVFINSKSIMIVPISSGGGMRVKIIEGMAFSKTIVSTTIGAAGIDYENEKNIIIADSPDEFALAICRCVDNIKYADEIGSNARKLVESKYDNQLICNELSDFYKELIQS